MRNDFMSQRARQDRALRKIANARWESPEQEQPSWRLAVAVATLALVVFFGQFGG